jgi:hypothetical protein
VDWDERAGRFEYDERYARKRPDWVNRIRDALAKIFGLGYSGVRRR